MLSLSTEKVGIRDYSRRSALYASRRDADSAESRAAHILMYSRTLITIHMPPEPLSILSRGLGERFGSLVTIRGKYGPTEIVTRDRSNFFLPMSATFDFSFVQAVVLSLLAIFLAYNILAGEREDGILQLVLANSLPRHKLLLGEYLGTALSVIAPSALASLMVITIIHAKGLFEFDRDLILRLLLFFIYTTIFVSTFVLLGLSISAIARSSQTALIIVFLAWTALVIVYPNLVAWGCNYLKPIDKVLVVNPQNIIAYSNRYLRERLLGELAEKQIELYRNMNFEQAQLVNKLWLLSPFSNFTLAAQAICEADLGSHQRFLQQARALEQAFIRWQEAKVRRYLQRERSYWQALGRLDLSGMPAPEYHPEDVSSLTARLFPALTIMLFWNIVLFLFSYVAFIKYDLRFS